MKILNQSLAVAIFSAGIAGAACAQSEQVGSDQVSGSESQAAATSFHELDKDQDGYINAVEATSDSTLMEKWTAADANADRKIDETEFSKFEANQTQTAATAPAAGDVSQGMDAAQEHGVPQRQDEMQQQQEGAASQY